MHVPNIKIAKKYAGLTLLVFFFSYVFSVSFGTGTAFALKCPNGLILKNGSECFQQNWTNISNSGPTSAATGKHLCTQAKNFDHQDPDGTCWAKGDQTKTSTMPVNDDGSPVDIKQISCQQYNIPGYGNVDTQYDPSQNTCALNCSGKDYANAGVGAIPIFGGIINGASGALAADCAACAAGLPGCSKVAPTIPDKNQPNPNNPGAQNCLDGSQPDPNSHKCKDGSDPGQVAGPSGPPIPKVSGRCGEARVNILVCGTQGGATALNNVLKIALQVLTMLVGVAALGGLTWASVQYARAADDSGVVSDAKKLIRNVIIGIILYGFLVAIVNWLLPGGVFG